ncbi:MAG: serine/threonine-protein kinase [Lapillicoccus sp.]
MGERFAGRYELLDPLGEGGMASVWRAWDDREGRVVAAKVLRQSDAVSLLRFVCEQAVRVASSHVLTPLGWAGEDDRVLFTMPIVDGGSVATLTGDYGPLPPSLVAELLRQLLDALGTVHDARILHGDVKPANLLLVATGRERPHLLLSDFGIAVDLHGPRFTQTGAFVGTPGFVPPEVLSGAEPHVTADLYAVGQVGLYLLTGLRGTPAEQARRRPEDVPDPLWDLLLALTATAPARRRQTAADALRRLQIAVLAWDHTTLGDAAVLRHVPDDPLGRPQLLATAPAPQIGPGQCRPARHRGGAPGQDTGRHRSGPAGAGLGPWSRAGDSAPGQRAFRTAIVPADHQRSDPRGAGRRCAADGVVALAGRGPVRPADHAADHTTDRDLGRDRHERLIGDRTETIRTATAASPATKRRVAYRWR